MAQSLAALAASSAPPVREIAAAAGMQAAAYDDLALAILTLPAPLELQRDPQLAQVYREALDSAVAPMLRQAVDAYDVCIARAVSPDWLAFCQGRAAALRATGLVATRP